MTGNRLLPSAMCLALLLAPASAHAQTFLGKPLASWLNEIDDKDPKIRRSAAFALGKFPDNTARVVEPLLKRIAEDKVPGVRDAAATALGDVILASGFGGAGYWNQAKPVLQRALTKETDERALRGVLYAIGCFGPGGASLQEEVQAQLGQKEASIRQNAAWTLGRMGEKAATSVPALIRLLSDRDALVRRDAATALGDVGLPAAQAAVPSLLQMVEKEDDEVAQKTALDKLINLVGPEEKDAAKQLVPLLNSKDPETAHLAAFVLAKIGGEEARPAVAVLRDALKDEEPQVQSLAAASLANLGPLATAAVPALGETLRTSTNKDVQRNCAVALANIGPDAQNAIPDILAVLKSNVSVEVRHFAAEALARMRSTLKPETQREILHVLTKEADKPSAADGRYSTQTIRQRCIWCLFNVEELSPQAIDVLSDILNENDARSLMVRYDAARALAISLGDKAPEKAAAVLLHMLRNEDLIVYNRTDTKVSGGATEASSGPATVKANTGGDARFLAAQALSLMGKTAKEYPGVMDELSKAAKGAKDEQLREEAKKALATLEAN